MERMGPEDQQGGLEHENRRALGVGRPSKGWRESWAAARGAVEDRIYPTLRRRRSKLDPQS